MNIPLHLLCDPAPHEIGFLPDPDAQLVLRTSEPCSLWIFDGGGNGKMLKAFEPFPEEKAATICREVGDWISDYYRREDAGEYD